MVAPNSLRARAVPLREATYCATTIFKQLEGLFSGLSYDLHKLRTEFLELRAQISVSHLLTPGLLKRFCLKDYHCRLLLLRIETAVFPPGDVTSHTAVEPHNSLRS